VRTIALQLYTVRQALAQDAENTLRQVCDAGYRTVETAPLPPGLAPREFGAMLRDNGLTVTAMHDELPLGDCQARVLDAAAALGTRRIIWHGWPRDPKCGSLEGYRRLADRYAEAARAAQANGLQLGLHTHWWECEPIGEVYPFQWLHQILPSEIFFEPDVYWARTAGLDPARVLRDLGGRVTMLHLKDGPAVHGQPMTALGEGVVDIPSVLRAAPGGAELVVELDECATAPLEAARRSLQFLIQNRLFDAASTG